MWGTFDAIDIQGPHPFRDHILCTTCSASPLMCSLQSEGLDTGDFFLSTPSGLERETLSRKQHTHIGQIIDSHFMF